MINAIETMKTAAPNRGPFAEAFTMRVARIVITGTASLVRAAHKLRGSPPR